jgi:antitoxin component YwqK of YwqJK toxin-antitoxin module
MDGGHQIDPPERTVLVDGRVVYEYRWPNGRPRWRFPYLDGQLHGATEGWWETGGTAFVVPRLHGVVNGLEIRFTATGQIERMTTWIGGSPID